MVSDPEGGHLGRMKERRVFLFEQLVIFSEPLEKKKGFSLPGFLYKNSIKVTQRVQKLCWFKGLQLPLVDNLSMGQICSKTNCFSSLYIQNVFFHSFNKSNDCNMQEMRLDN